jgi:hypothetical protein
MYGVYFIFNYIRVLASVLSPIKTIRTQLCGPESLHRNSYIYIYLFINLLRWLSSGMFHRVVWYILTDVPEALTAFNNRVMGHLHTRCGEKLYFHLTQIVYSDGSTVLMACNVPTVTVIKNETCS